MEGSGSFDGITRGFETGIEDTISIDWGSDPQPTRWPEAPLSDRFPTFDQRVPRVNF
jgi:hypothetical protein